MNCDKYHCPKCKLLFDSNNHVPRILPTCSHSLCSYCITEQLHQTHNSISCPIDKIAYNDIASINFFKENTNLIEELQESLNIPTNHNYEISNEDIFFDNDKSLIMNSDKFNDTMNSLNLNCSIISSSHCYYKKSKNIRNSLKEKNNLMCEKHTLPLNVICIDEKKKICSQCALNDEHVSHQIITEEEFMNNIDNLIDLFQEVDNNQIKYLNFNNINTKSTLDKIKNNIDNYIKMINKTKEDMINNIKTQCEKIENYLNERIKEIFGKYQSTNFDISTLRESTLNWMQNVTIKLDQLNEIKAGEESGCLKLLDNDPNKNIFNLIRNGKQLNGRYNFVQETIKIIDKLESFDKKGINIMPNKNIINRIFIEEDKNKDEKNENKNEDKDKDKNIEDEDDIELNLNIDELGKKNNIKNENEKKIKEEQEKNIKSTLFQIKENNELINSLHLTKFKFDFIDIKITNDIEDKNKEKEKENKENEKEENNINKDNNININDNNNNDNKKKEVNNNINDKHNTDVDPDGDEDNEILFNLNINEIKENNKENDKNENNKKDIKKNIENKNDKNNISKIIDEISFNDDTLLINPLNTNQNDTVYHRKLRKDYAMDLKKKKEKENSINEKNNIQTNIDNQIQPQIQTKTITTKKIDISELKNSKANEQKNNYIINTNINSNSNVINYNDNRSVGNDIESNTTKNKNEILINFNRRISGHKKTLQIGSNNLKSDKKLFLKQNSGEKSPNPIMMSRSPGRMISKSKLAGFYNFVPYDKNTKKKKDNNQNNNLEKTVINKNEFTNRNKYNKNTFNINDDNDTNTEYSSNLNDRRTSFCINKAVKKNKAINKDNTINSNLIKKINSTKYMTNIENPKIENNYNNTNSNLNSNIQINKSNNLITNSILNNSSNSFENKSKKELQDFINNQLKNNIPNFSRINMNGYGMQYLCSYLHKNPNTNYKEIKLLGCNINDDDLFMLTRTLLDHEIGLLVLNLSSNKITDDSAANILDLLKDCKSLKGLSLYNNMIGGILKDKLKEYAKLGRKNFETVQLYI